MSTTIGPDGLTDEERAATDGDVEPSSGDAACDRLESVLETLAAERLAHAETRAALRLTDLVTCECCGNRLPSHTACPDDEDNVYTCGRCMAGLAGMLVARAEKAEAERDRLWAALDDLVGSARSLVGACEEDRLCPVCGSNSNIENCTASCYVPRTHKRIQAARALLGEVKP